MHTNWINEEYVKDLVSVIIPTYNRETLLKEAIKSVSGQTYRPIECIIVDDGSTDGTKKMAEELMELNSDFFSIKYFYKNNEGAQVARNTGTLAAAGEFIQYLDSDDLLNKEKIEKQVIYLRNNKECDGVWGDWYFGTVQDNEFKKSIQEEDQITQLLTGSCIHTLSFLMRRNIVSKIGAWDINIKRNQEIDFQVRGLLAGAIYEYQPINTGLWRIHDGERIANSTGTKELLSFYNKWEAILNSKGLFNDQMKKNISNIYFWFALQGNKLAIKDKANLLMAAVRLNPSIGFIQTPKMRFLIKLFGLKISITMWLKLISISKK